MQWPGFMKPCGISSGLIKPDESEAVSALSLSAHGERSTCTLRRTASIQRSTKVFASNSKFTARGKSSRKPSSSAVRFPRFQPRRNLKNVMAFVSRRCSILRQPRRFLTCEITFKRARSGMRPGLLVTPLRRCHASPGRSAPRSTRSPASPSSPPSRSAPASPSRPTTSPSNAPAPASRRCGGMRWSAGARGKATRWMT